jgi:type IX secretion system PorP/SprF family membrane protein
MNNLDEHLFAYFEGEMNPADKLALEQFVAGNPEAAREFNAWEATMVVAEEQEYPLAGELLSGGAGSAWMRWSMGLLLFAGTGLSLFMITEGISGRDRAASGSESLAYHTQPTQSAITVIKQDDETTTTTTYQQGNSTTNPVFTEVFGTPDAEADGNTVAENVSTSTGSIVHTTTSTNAVWGDPESGYRYGREGGRGSYKPGLNNAALEEAMDYFNKPTASNQRRYRGDYDDALENKVYRSEKESLAKRMRDKLAKTFRQPLGIVNLKDPYFVMPDYRGVTEVNPAFTGSLNVTRFKVSSRGRWLGTDQQSVGGSIGLDGYMKPLKTGIGLNLNYDAMLDGRIGGLEAGLTLSPKFQLSREVWLETGIRYTFGTRMTNWDRMPASGAFELPDGVVMPNQLSGYSDPMEVKHYHDLSAGVLLNTKKFYVGISGSNLLRPAVRVLGETFAPVPESDYRLPAQFSLQAGTDYRFHSNYQVVISPYAILSHRNGVNTALMGTFVRLNHFITGASVNNRLDFAVMAGFETRNIRMGYTYDRNTSAIYDKKLGSHSITTRVLLGKRGGVEPILKY